MAHLPVAAEFYTIGYSGKDLNQFVALLRAVGVSTLIDIRNAPVSQYKPDFSKGNLQAHLAALGIKYVHRGDWGVPHEVRDRIVGGDSRDAIWDWYDTNVIPRISAGEFGELRRQTKPPLAFMCVRN